MRLVNLRHYVVEFSEKHEYANGHEYWANKQMNVICEDLPRAVELFKEQHPKDVRMHVVRNLGNAGHILIDVPEPSFTPSQTVNCSCGQSVSLVEATSTHHKFNGQPCHEEGSE
jgi:hypothetical protein